MAGLELNFHMKNSQRQQEVRGNKRQRVGGGVRGSKSREWECEGKQC